MEPFEDARVIAAAGRITPIDGAGSIDRYTRLLDLGPNPRTVDQATADWFEICNFGGVGTGGNMAVRRSALDWWPGFRESLGLGSSIPSSEEHNAFFEFVRRGFRVAYAAGAVVRHPFPRTESEFREVVSRNATYNMAYATLLLLEEPRYRGRVLRYMFEAALGKDRPWRPSTARLRAVGISPPRLAINCVRGTILYLRSGSRPRAQPTRVSPPTDHAVRGSRATPTSSPPPGASDG
jgi:hypothetical protein